MNVIRKLVVRPGRAFKLRAIDPGSTPGCSSREKAEDALPAMLEELRSLGFTLEELAALWKEGEHHA